MQTHPTIIHSQDNAVLDRPILGFLIVVVALMHAVLVMQLLEPSDNEDIKKPVKVVEVVLLRPEPVTPKEKAAPPAPVQPAVQKNVTPKKQPPKKIVKPVIKKEAIIPTKPAPKKPAIEDRPPVLTAPATSIQKPAFSVSPSLRPAIKPAIKPGNGDANSKGATSGVALISRVKPVYPARATSRHIEGWVKIEFTVTPSGAVSNPSVVSASPPGIFDSAAQDAIMKWRFKPKMVNGQAVAQRAVQTIKFTLSK